MIRDKCGVFGIFGARNAGALTYLGLYSLQHRGQESCGIVSANGGGFHSRMGMGLVNEVFSSQHDIQSLRGLAAIGHNRYSTTGSSSPDNIQPLVTNSSRGYIALGHNGNLTNYHLIKKDLEKKGSIFRTTSDTEVIMHLLARSRRDKIEDALAEALGQVIGAYSLTLLTPRQLVAARDPAGVRPLALGKRRKAWVVASESCAFDIIGAKYVRDIEPGEIIVIDKNGVKSRHLPKKPHSYCIFEFIYFSRPDSRIFGGTNVDKVRRRLGRALAKEHPVEADIIISVPDSSNTAALGYSEESRIPYDIGLIRNHYVGRTFIRPEQKIRDLDVKIKFNVVKGVVKNKRVVLVDDSLVRGTTSKKLVKMLRDAGAREVHLRLSSPPITNPCFYGIDMPTKKELIASRKSVEAIRRYLGADSVGYLSLERMLQMPSLPRGEGFCHACFSGRYPIRILDKNRNNHKNRCD
ncbi:MAG: amidophosphoribosyltransferase [candidate division Zixibacteria bacterium RBG_16_53_22]|nr:MAG: amidophosphoribosyltransferase [candidate division Zixibacteria bacterium RBG_16_53_22]